jgi:16S rRNA (cytidine1402-2'-O)-methyltransferase
MGSVSKTGTLYLVGTPIGNVGDMSPRAQETLAAVDLVAAEDTRRTGRLLARLGIKAKLVSYFEGNEARRTEELVAALKEGRDVAVVSDAGMPGLSDPGYRVVKACVDKSIDVRVVPGPSAVIAALVASGLPTVRFAFEGFLPRKVGARRARLQELAGDPRTLVLFESPTRVAQALEEIEAVLGDRPVAVVRELTKLHEEVLRGRASEVRSQLTERAGLRGEVVMVVDGAAETAPPSLDSLFAEARDLVAQGMRKRRAAAEVAHRHGANANAVYEALVGREISPPRD